MRYRQFTAGECIYENPLSEQKHIDGWVLEGNAKISFEENRLHLENELDPDVHGDNAHWVFWCKQDFPDQIMIEWEFYPIKEPGLCMIFFAANGKSGLDLFDPSLPVREGKYPQYHSGSMDALHLSYFRHKHADERAFRTCNLRKSCGFHLVAHGADPLPPVEDALPPYRIKLIKYEQLVQFSINELPILEWEDDGRSYGPVYGGGKIGLRQMAPMKAAYANLKVSRILAVD
ncbi:protein of unknown function [Evansella caseinilytica]|uniref:DUF1961 family protein n=1 Tax=Evansella caseinilytica TaxID=1503961 RepID=A0A1H3GJI4_9BACI|nr:DUF1961 family protein [Evansella caseinilytica]SDY03476.1 protein of unknown function [Evansella caseinilytica]